MSKPFHIFEVTGVELEYMIVDRDTLQVRPIADELIYEVTGDYNADAEMGSIAWSNELVSHVIELKTNGPVGSLEGLSEQFLQNVLDINQRLEKLNAKLLPTGAHPFMDPFTQTVIWPHEHNEVYNLYNRIFDCRGHGWANLQSTHINLPFANDEEFGRLHAAIRVLLPILPAITASSPILDGKNTGYLDMRLETYRHNQDRLPVIAGLIIPEAVFTEGDYEKEVFDPIRKSIAPLDPNHILSKYFLNSRGAIARFDRGAIEIRIIDIQEAPVVDVAIVDLIVTVLKWLVSEEGTSFQQQKELSTKHLSDLFLVVIKEGRHARFSSAIYSKIWGIDSSEVNPEALWKKIFEIVRDKLLPASQEIIEMILHNGSLSERILQAIGPRADEERIAHTYHRLAECLSTNKSFLP